MRSAKLYGEGNERQLCVGDWGGVRTDRGPNFNDGLS